MADRSTDDIAARLDELEETLAEIGETLEASRRPGRAQPRDLLRFADEYAIPAAIATLEANVRALELLRAGIRAREGGPAAESSPDRAGAAEAGRAALDRALADLESALAGSGLPADREARELLAEARRLNDRIGERVASEAGRGTDDVVRIEVESELESIREEVADEED